MRKLRFLISVLPLVCILAAAGCSDEGSDGPKLAAVNVDASGGDGGNLNTDGGSDSTSPDATVDAGPCVGLGEGAPCDDGYKCTVNEKCTNGVCKGGLALVCDDNNQCTTDKCDPASGCVFSNNTATCDDGDKCTVGEMCKDGVCGGGLAPACNDNSPCTNNTCDPTTGCVFVPMTGLACDDGNGCTTSDICSVAGVCTGGPALSCNDNNSCTTDVCDSIMGGCKHTALSGMGCDDGDPSTIGDVCSISGLCKGNSIACDDSNACTLDGGNPPSCTHGQIVCDDKNLCTDDACDQAKGCTFTNNTAACDDGDACTSGDKCLSGVCKGGLAPACDDLNTCTTDSCDKTKGCTHVALTGTACDDGSKCTLGEMCKDGVCAGGIAPACDDLNTCTGNTCDPTSGCVFIPLTGTACNDGNSCTTSDQCSFSGVCVGGVGPNCNDANSCTMDSCDVASGCKHTVLTGAACDDGNPLSNGDSCTANGTCKGVSVACDDGNACTVDGGEAPPACTHVATVCNDNNICTTDSCDAIKGCTFLPSAGTVICDDGNLCTNNDVCAFGTCTSGTVLACNDGDPCTVDACVPAVGACSYKEIPGCGTGEICGNGTDDDGDLKIDCADSECGAGAKAYVLYGYASYGGTIKFSTADKPSVIQEFALPADAPSPNAQSYTLHCNEVPFTATLSAKGGGMLKAWVQGTIGATVDQKIASTPKFWELGVWSTLSMNGPPSKANGFSSPDGNPFVVTWPVK